MKLVSSLPPNVMIARVLDEEQLEYAGDRRCSWRMRRGAWRACCVFDRGADLGVIRFDGVTELGGLGPHLFKSKWANIAQG